MPIFWWLNPQCSKYFKKPTGSYESMVHRKKSHCTSLHEGSNGWAKVNLKRWMPREAVRGSLGLPANCPIDFGSLGGAPWFYRSPGLPSGIGWDIPELAMEVYSWENHRTKSWISIATFDCPRAMYHDFSAIWLSYLLWGCKTHRCSSSQPKPCKTSPKSTTWTSMSKWPLRPQRSSVWCELHA
jgi:hypothetical protein